MEAQAGGAALLIGDFRADVELADGFRVEGDDVRGGRVIQVIGMEGLDGGAGDEMDFQDPEARGPIGAEVAEDGAGLGLKLPEADPVTRLMVAENRVRMS